MPDPLPTAHEFQRRHELGRGYATRLVTLSARMRPSITSPETMLPYLAAFFFISELCPTRVYIFSATSGLTLGSPIVVSDLSSDRTNLALSAEHTTVFHVRNRQP